VIWNYLQWYENGGYIDCIILRRGMLKYLGMKHQYAYSILSNDIVKNVFNLKFVRFLYVVV